MMVNLGTRCFLALYNIYLDIYERDLFGIYTDYKCRIVLNGTQAMKHREIQFQLKLFRSRITRRTRILEVKAQIFIRALDTSSEHGILVFILAFRAICMTLLRFILHGPALLPTLTQRKLLNRLVL